MKRRHLALALIALLVPLAQPGTAQTAQDRIVAQLRDQGFDEITITRTLLGRVRIVAEEDDTLREIILNPSTGAILRDYWTELDDDDDHEDGRDDDDDYDDDDDRRRVLDDEYERDDD